MNLNGVRLGLVKKSLNHIHAMLPKKIRLYSIMAGVAIVDGTNTNRMYGDLFQLLVFLTEVGKQTMNNVQSALKRKFQ